MSYTIYLPTGNTFAVVNDGTINSSSSVTLVGKNYAGYGQFLDQNFINLLTNMANGTAPGSPLTGQLWFDTANYTLQVYNGTAFKALARLSSAPYSSPPTLSGTIPGELWYDSTNQQLNVSTGNAWVLVGPTSTGGQGTTGAIAATVSDGTSNHVITELYVANALVGTISKDASFTANTVLGINNDWPQAQVIAPGITLNSNIGTAPQFRSTSGGFVIGGGNISLTQSGANAILLNNINLGNIVVQANITGGTVSNVITINGSTGAVSIPSLIANVSGNVSAANVTGSLTNITNIVASGYITATGNITTGGILNSTGNITGGNISTAGNISGSYIIGNGSLLTGLPASYGNTQVAAYLPTYGGSIGVTGITNTGSAGVGNIGASGQGFNTVFAKATSAEYADVAERFAADAEYLPGTVVEIGGSAEITQAVSELSDKIFGVISTKPAYLMNSAAGHDLSHPPIAMTGRVPVRVVGAVKKGDRLVSAGNGLARSAQPGEATPFTTIGRALRDKVDTAEGTVEAIVTIK